MKVLFLLFLLSTSVFAGTVSSQIGITSKKNEVRESILTVDAPLGKKSLVYQKGDLRFYASITEFKDAMPEMPNGTSVLIYGEIYLGSKVVARPHVVTMLGQEATFNSTIEGQFIELKFRPMRLTR